MLYTAYYFYEFVMTGRILVSLDTCYERMTCESFLLLIPHEFMVTLFHPHIFSSSHHDPWFGRDFRWNQATVLHRVHEQSEWWRQWRMNHFTKTNCSLYFPSWSFLFKKLLSLLLLTPLMFRHMSESIHICAGTHMHMQSKTEAWKELLQSLNDVLFHHSSVGTLCLRKRQSALRVSDRKLSLGSTARPSVTVWWKARAMA